VRLLARAYRNGDLRGARLVVAATDSLDVNRRVCTEAQRRRILANCAAPPDAGNFIVPSVVRRGVVTIAISTAGTKPEHAKALRLKLEKLLR
jgi:precorrin-2 dehydrogenase/sirohydrochlorin ferrochelatase